MGGGWSRWAGVRQFSYKRDCIRLFSISLFERHMAENGQMQFQFQIQFLIIGTHTVGYTYSQFQKAFNQNGLKNKMKFE